MNWGDAETIKTDDTIDAKSPRLAASPSGSAIVLWQRFDGASSEIWVNRYE